MQTSCVNLCGPHAAAHPWLWIGSSSHSAQLVVDEGLCEADRRNQLFAATECTEQILALSKVEPLHMQTLSYSPERALDLWLCAVVRCWRKREGQV